MKKNIILSIIFFVLAVAILVLTFLPKLEGENLQTWMYLAATADLCTGSIFLCLAIKTKLPDKKKGYRNDTSH